MTVCNGQLPILDLPVGVSNAGSSLLATSLAILSNGPSHGQPSSTFTPILYKKTLSTYSPVPKYHYSMYRADMHILYNTSIFDEDNQDGVVYYFKNYINHRGTQKKNTKVSSHTF